MSARFSLEKGDWVCPNKRCANINFSKREKCNKCGESRPRDKAVVKTGIEIGKEAAEKSKGLFSPDDWQCKTCGNVNWARRSVCNVCNQPRVNTLGQRTGYGGGFMERDEVVEYKKRDDSDDEYDEFGRKKKQYRAKQTTTTIVDKKASISKEDNDDEEDDEEEDGDLSKYDIWGDEETEDKKPSEKTKVIKKSSRSSSSSRSSYSSSGSSTSRSSKSSKGRKYSKNQSAHFKKHSHRSPADNGRRSRSRSRSPAVRSKRR